MSVDFLYAAYLFGEVLELLSVSTLRFLSRTIASENDLETKCNVGDVRVFVWYTLSFNLCEC